DIVSIAEENYKTKNAAAAGINGRAAPDSILLFMEVISPHTTVRAVSRPARLVLPSHSRAETPDTAGKPPDNPPHPTGETNSNRPQRVSGRRVMVSCGRRGAGDPIR